MFRQLPTIAIVSLAALACPAALRGGEPAPGEAKQITNSIGMRLLRIAPGEFQMGSSESAEATAAFFNKYFFGDDTKQLGDYSWNGTNSGLKTHAVGGKRPNAWGLYDMEGNVAQWCRDWYGSSYYTTSPTDDPTGPATGSDRVLRGNNWGGLEYACRSANRFKSPNLPGTIIGFRVSMVAPVKK
jgi:formylglycine-generating enzyme required for sulfatase activity